MSVEDAFREWIENVSAMAAMEPVCGGASEHHPEVSEYLEANGLRYLERLILEVQSGMPCYVWKELQPGSRPCACPSCTARAALTKVSA